MFWDGAVDESLYFVQRFHDSFKINEILDSEDRVNAEPIISILQVFRIYATPEYPEEDDVIPPKE